MALLAEAEKPESGIEANQISNKVHPLEESKDDEVKPNVGSFRDGSDRSKGGHHDSH